MGGEKRVGQALYRFTFLGQYRFDPMRTTRSCRARSPLSRNQWLKPRFLPRQALPEGSTGSSRLPSISHLSLKRLPHQAHDVWQFVERGQADLDIAITPAANPGHVFAESLRVGDLDEA